jgi:hypothetical protein
LRITLHYTGNGVKIIPLVFNGENPLKGQSIYQCPNKGHLSISDWTLWRRALKKAFQLEHQGLIPVPRSRWIDSPTRQWFAWHDPNDSTIYQRMEGNRWRRYHQIPVTVNTRPRYVRGEFVDHFPDDYRRAVVWDDDANGLQTSSSARMQTSNDNNNPISFHDAVDNLLPEQAWAMEYLVDSGNVKGIAHGLPIGTVITVADGSFKHELGTSGFTLIDKVVGHRLEGANIIPGQHIDQNAYRSELGGVYGIMPTY